MSRTDLGGCPRLLLFDDLSSRATSNNAGCCSVRRSRNQHLPCGEQQVPESPASETCFLLRSQYFYLAPRGVRRPARFDFPVVIR